MKKYLFYTALIGFIASVIVHALALADIDANEKVPFVWVLHIGIFAVMLPIILDLQKNKELQVYKQRVNTEKLSLLGLYKIVFKDVPPYAVVLLGVLLVYTVINFFIFFTAESGTPNIINGQFVLQHQGVTIKTITEQEYHHFKAANIRGFSGHWMWFYSVATALLYKYSGWSKQVT
jgi:hypothetical protein